MLLDLFTMLKPRMMTVQCPGRVTDTCHLSSAAAVFCFFFCNLIYLMIYLLPL